MSYLEKLRPGKRKNAFYEKNGIRPKDNYKEERARMPEEIYVYEWDADRKAHVGHLVNTAEYYGRYNV